MKLKSFTKKTGLHEMMSKDGLVDAIVRAPGVEVVEVVEDGQRRAGRVVDVKLASKPANAASATRQSDALLATKGLEVHTRSGEAGFGLCLVEMAGKGVGGNQLVATVEGDLDVRLADLGLVEIGRTTLSSSGAAAAIATYGKASGVLGRTNGYLAVPLGGHSLIVNDVTSTVTPSAPLSLAGRVYRLASTGLLMTFDSVMFSATADRTDVDLRGGKIVRVA